LGALSVAPSAWGADAAGVEDTSAGAADAEGKPMGGATMGSTSWWTGAAITDHRARRRREEENPCLRSPS
jgi:hypothetical protein